MSEVLYNPLEDDDVKLPIYKKDGKNSVFPAFISGMKTTEITSKKSGEDMLICELEFEIHESTEKMQPVTIFEEDEDGKYNYRRPKEEVPATTFTGERVKSGNNAKLWKNLTKGSCRMNRILIENLKVLGVDLKTKKVETDGKKVDALIIPDLTEDLLLGLPVFIWLDQNSFTANDGRNISYTVVGKFVSRDGDRVTVLENSLKETGGKPAVKAEDDPFGDLDDDLPF